MGMERRNLVPTQSLLLFSLNGRGREEENPWERFGKRRRKVAFCSCYCYFFISVQRLCNSKYLMNIFTELMIFDIFADY